MSETQIMVFVQQDDADEAEQIISEQLSEAGLLHSVEVYR